jgi:putative thioredoxin
MGKGWKSFSRAGALLALTGVIAAFTGLQSCGKQPPKEAGQSGPVIAVRTQDQFDRIIETSDEQLVVIDFYADWCAPCRMLSPMLERVALSFRNRASFYKVDIEKMPAAATAFGVRSIPHVAFILGGEQRQAIRGLNAQTTYEEAIRRLTDQ